MVMKNTFRAQPMRLVILTLLGMALLGGLLTMGLAGRLASRLAAERQRQAIEAKADQLGAMASVACSVENRSLAEAIVRRLAQAPDIGRVVLRSHHVLLAEAGRVEAYGSGHWIYRPIPSPFSKAVTEGELILVPDQAEAARRAARTATSLRQGALGLIILLALAFVLTLRRRARSGPSLRDQMRLLKAETGVLFACPMTQDQDEIGQLAWDLDTLLEHMTSFRIAIRAAQQRSAENRLASGGGNDQGDNLSLRSPSEAGNLITPPGL
jgi:hypothetical protein